MIKKIFTLVEIIIVISILIILSFTISFGIIKYLSKSRDSKRIVDLKQLATKLDIYNINSDYLPYPDDYIIISFSGFNLTYQGYVGENVITNINYNKIPKDILDNSYYFYSLSYDRKKYQVGTFLENDIYNMYTGNLDRYFYSIGNNVGIVLSGNNYINFNLDLNGSIGYYTVVFSNKKVYEGDGKIIFGWIKYYLSPEWCRYVYNSGTYDNNWNIILDLGFDGEKCYIFGDEDDIAIDICNKRVLENVPKDEEWIWVPARWFVTDGTGIDLKDSFYQKLVVYNGNYYICRGFAVSKYELSDGITTGGVNSYDGRWETKNYLDYTTDIIPVSKKGYLALTYMNGNEAINLCKNKGREYHLVTNNEWMAIARNIENNKNSWSDSGFVPIGRIEDLNMGCDGNADNTWAEPTGIGCELTYNDGLSRNVLRLTNGSEIYDFVGNVREIVDRDNNFYNNIGTGRGDICGENNYWYNNGNPYDSCPYLGPTFYNAKNGINIGMGYVFNSFLDNRIFIRGGDAGLGDRGGLYALYLDWDEVTRGVSVGFRCVK